MQKLLCFLLAFFLCTAAFTQVKGSAKLYGYVQTVSGGARPKLSGNNATEGARKNYLLYAASASRIYPVVIWVEGVQYGVTLTTVKTPVEFADENNIGSPKKTLVAVTKQKVVQLILNSTPQKKASLKTAASLAKKNAVVLIYRLGDKDFYSLLKNLSTLESASMQ